MIELLEKIKASTNTLLGKQIQIDLFLQLREDIRWNIPTIIRPLQRGEKYERMWEECKKDISRASVENWKVSAERFVLEMKKLEQKYFSKD